jgi:hypothetical protein
MTNYLAFVALIVALIGTVSPVFAQENSRSSKGRPHEFLTGMLTVVDFCPISDCGPKYKLWTNDMSACVALEGPIRDEDNGRIIRVRGNWKSGVPGAPKFCGYNANPDFFVVQSYAVRSRIEYFEFLRAAKVGLSERVYGCRLSWNTSHLWRLDRGGPELIIRLTSSPGDPGSRYVEYVFDGMTGRYLRNEDNLNGVNPCP